MDDLAILARSEALSSRKRGRGQPLPSTTRQPNDARYSDRDNFIQGDRAALRVNALGNYAFEIDAR